MSPGASAAAAPPPGAPRRLRIAVFNRRFDASGGGAERYSVALVARLAPRHDFEIYAQQFGTGVQVDGGAVGQAHSGTGAQARSGAAGQVDPGAAGAVQAVRHRVPLAGLRPRWLNQLWFASYTWWHTRRGYDLVHSHEATWHGQIQTVHVRTVRAGLFAGRHGAARARRWLECAVSPRLWVYLGLEAARLRPRPGRIVIAVSQPLRAQLEALYPALAAAGGRTELLAPGVDSVTAAAALGSERRGRTRAFERSTWALAGSAPILLLVANDFAKKGLATLLDCLPLLRCAARLVVVGGASAALADWKRRVAASGLAARVRFAGTLADPAAAYLAADILVHPTREDTFGMVVLEAMAQGLPVIVSGAAHCGIAAELEPERDALVLEQPDDAAALAGAIDRLWRDVRLRALLVEGGLRFAAARDWAVVAARQEAIYLRALGA
jgi:UDP-glucose:(heptosyl)LPS alpha-1,3-glucosyltransferase